MIIDFKFKNFKNFKEKTDFSFEKGNKTELQEHIIKKNDYELLPIKVIYGSNSVGKSNILTAFLTLKRIIINGTARKDENDYIGLCSNFDSKKDYETPIEFAITFLINEEIYNYKLHIKNHYAEKTSEVVYETLKIDKEMIFERKKRNIEFSNKKNIIEKYYPLFKQKSFQDKVKASLKDNILNTSIFTTWLQNYSGNLCQKIKEYFLNQTRVISNLEKQKISVPESIRKEINSSHIKNNYIDKLLKELDLNKQKIEFVKEDNTNEMILTTMYKFSDSNEGVITQANAIESKGTLKLIDLILTFVYSLKNGTILWIDELDASIHHEIIYSILSAYGDPDINKNGAQLVFTTHNPVYMNEKLLRRDEIVFVEKDDNTSYIQTLDDYDIRKDKKYLKNYLAGEFTLLPNFDLGAIINNEKS